MRNRIPRRIGLLLLAATLAGFAFGQDAFSLVRKPKMGQVLKYQNHVDMVIAGTTAVYTAVFTERVVEIGEDGSYVTLATQSDVRVRYGEKDYSPDPPGANKVKYSAGGDLLDVSGDTERAAAFRLAYLTNIQGAKKAVKPGDKWTVDVKPPESGVVGGKANYEMLKIEQLGSFKTAVVKFSYKESSGTSPAESEGTVWLNIEDGTLVKYEINIKNAPFPGAPGLVDAKMVSERMP